VTLQSASVSIGSGYNSKQDVLSVAAQIGISAQWDPVTGTLLLSGPAPVAAYQAELQSVSYENTSDIPDTTPRIVDFSVTDGQLNSAVVSRQIDLAAGDSPYNLVPGAQATDQGSPLVFSYSAGNPLHVGDVASGGQVSVTLAARKGTITLSQTNGLTFVVGTGTSNITMTFTGAIADVNASLEGLQFQPTDGYSGPALLKITTVGLGNSSQGGPPRVESTVQINIRPLPLPPGGEAPPEVVVTPPPISVSLTGDQGKPVTVDPIGPGYLNGNPLNHRPHGGFGTSAGASGDDGGGANPNGPAAPVNPDGPHADNHPANKGANAPLPARTTPRNAPPVAVILPPAVPSAASDFWRQLDQVGQDLDSEHHSTQLTVGTTSAVTALMSIGYVIWAVRGASMAASFLATLPMWRWMDPLPVLESWDSRKRKAIDGDDEDDADEERLRSLTDELE